MTRRPRSSYYGSAHDERVDPHADLTPPMPDPDWGGIVVQPNQKKMPVGDPTLWANTITTVIDSDPILGSTPRVIFGDQIILAQAADRYARSWSVIGNVTVPLNVTADTEPTPPSGSDQAIATGALLEVWLNVTLGIEKITIAQDILLLSGIVDATVVPPIGNYGLCNNQSSIVGGPYGYQFNVRPVVFSPATRVTLSFACVGAFIGNTLSARAIYVRNGVAGQPLDVPDATVSLLITPYAPGQGI